MTDTEKIQAVLNEAMSGAGAMISVRTMCALVQQRCDELGEQTTITSILDFAENAANIASKIAEKPGTWTSNGRFNQTLFAREIDTETAYKQSIANTLAETLYLMDNAYQDQFRIDGAVTYLKDVAKYCGLFSEELEKA